MGKNTNADRREEPDGKMKIPLDIQKSMMEFFMRTSIPRKKAKSDKPPLPAFKEGGLL